MATTQPSPGPSALERASRIKKDQGFHECEVSVRTGATAAEADLHKHHTMCTKNPGHKAFIPVNKFKMEHLPERYRDNDILNFIRAIINLTVRVCVRFTSFDRIETFPGTGEPYPFYNNRGSKGLRTGTGMVSRVDSYTDENKIKEGKKKMCPCEQCKDHISPKTQWFEVRVSTARHLVFDDTEAKHTSCQLFYDSDEEKKKIVELNGDVVCANTECDRSWMSCFTHDLVMGRKLQEMLDLYMNQFRKVHALNDESRNCVIEQPLTVVVSHPHACSKKVTVGECIKKYMIHSQCIEEVKCECFSYKYTAQTCPGSSGAPVYIFGISGVLSNLHTMCCVSDGLSKSVATFDVSRQEIRREN